MYYIPNLAMCVSSLKRRHVEHHQIRAGTNNQERRAGDLLFPFWKHPFSFSRTVLTSQLELSSSSWSFWTSTKLGLRLSLLRVAALPVPLHAHTSACVRAYLGGRHRSSICLSVRLLTAICLFQLEMLTSFPRLGRAFFIRHHQGLNTVLKKCHSKIAKINTFLFLSKKCFSNSLVDMYYYMIS